MDDAVKALWLRMLAYIASPLWAGVIPASLLGYLTFDTSTGDLAVMTNGIWTMLISGATASALVWWAFGIKPPDWALDEGLLKALAGSISRVFTYAMSSAVGALPAGWAGLIEWTASTGVLVLHLGGIPAALAAGGVLSAGLYQLFGWKPKDVPKP